MPQVFKIGPYIVYFWSNENEPLECVHTYYLYAITLKKEWAGEKRDALIKMMNDEYGVGCVVANAPQYAPHPSVASQLKYVTTRKSSPSPSS